MYGLLIGFITFLFVAMFVINAILWSQVTPIGQTNNGTITKGTITTMIVVNSIFAFLALFGGIAFYYNLNSEIGTLKKTAIAFRDKYNAAIGVPLSEAFQSSIPSTNMECQRKIAAAKADAIAQTASAAAARSISDVNAAVNAAYTRAAAVNAENLAKIEAVRNAAARNVAVNNLVDLPEGLSFMDQPDKDSYPFNRNNVDQY